MNKRNMNFDFDGKKILLISLGILTILLFAGGWVYDVQMAETRTPEMVAAEAQVLNAQTNLLSQVENVIGTSGEAATTSGPFLLYAGGGLLLASLAVVTLGVGIAYALGLLFDKTEKSVENFANNGFVYQRTRKDGRQSSFMLASGSSAGQRPKQGAPTVRMVEPERPRLPDSPADRFKSLISPDDKTNGKPY